MERGSPRWGIPDIGKADIKREGEDVTIVTFQTTRVVEAAAELAKRGIEAEIVDLRSLRPRRKAIYRSVKRPIDGCG